MPNPQKTAIPAICHKDMPEGVTDTVRDNMSPDLSGDLGDYRCEFPDYDDAGLRERLPSSLRDWSWHNDACPRFVNLTARLSLWCDYAGREARECGPDAPRFVLCATDDAGYPVCEIAENESLSGILTAYATAVREDIGREAARDHAAEN